MNQNFNIAIWGTWEKQFFSMIVDYAGAVVDPCLYQFLDNIFID